MKICSYAILIPLVFATAAFANPNVNSPYNGETVGSSFTLSASSGSCSSQWVAAMAYSIDNGPDLVTVNQQSMDIQVSAPGGWHTLHVKSWGDKGAGCMADVSINVQYNNSSGSGGGGGGPYIPSNATKASNLQTMGNWQLGNDPGNGGWSSGKMGLVGWPSYSGTARQTVTNYGGAGGERYWVSFGDDTQATNFVYDAWVYLPSSDGNLANLEMDMNQVMPNGQTVIYGFECDGYNNTWDYTMNKGSADHPNDTWIRSNAKCNLSGWSRNTWHHVQVAYSRNGSGVVNYQAVWLDGNKETINAWVPSAFSLGWAPVLLTNLQVDGRGSGGWLTVYIDDLTIYRW